MANRQNKKAEALRLEALWQGDFGDQYVDRNKDAGKVRGVFWQKLLKSIKINNALEVGCNVGANLQWIAQKIGPKNTYGLDINEKALRQLQVNIPGINTIWAPARELPFRDRWFDLVFTVGVLIHQPESTLPLVMSEIVRCSKKYILCGEYYDEKTTEVHYRGQQGALFRRDYGRIYLELFPQLKLVKKGFLSREQGWDNVTYWLFRKQAAG